MEASSKPFILLSVLLLYAALFTPIADGRGEIMWLTISGNISPATAEYIVTSMESAREYSAVLITIDTFGGLGDSTFKIIDVMLNSSVPTIVYVYPPGGQALSAGTYILMASSLAAMAPYTTIGSAQPVVNGVPSNDTKLINFLVEKMRGMARLHGRNETQAARFVTHNDNLGPEVALRHGAIEVVASDVYELLDKADGMKVMTLYGETVLQTRGARLVKIEPGFRIQVLQFLSDPLVSGLFLTLGVLILIVGLSSPGFGGEILGAVLLILGLVGQGFNLNWAGLALIILGSVLILYEFYSGGVVAAMVGGIILLSLGLILLVRAPPGVIYVSQEWLNELQVAIGLVAAFGGGVTAFILFKILRATRRKSYELAPMAGIGRSVEDIEAGKLGYVVVAGEYRRAKALKTVKQNQEIRIVGVEDKILLVEPLE
ncbi:MAG: nodulation protein NfeD [Nitrososphaerota archaeon]|nr:nodulation protein NfeD [Candidatus Calditenuaceae archaeon]MDW8073695.1 nodulation protein NfeD [Nitrososphaerota archaeon]